MSFETTPKISVIIPVYNVEKYLEKCMDSIVRQTLKDIEIICVNDGSTDNSINILEKYAKADKRIKIISKSNTGYGHSMNIGLDNAKGEYIGIVEPDDFVELNMFEELYNKAEENNVDVIKGNYYKHSTNPKEKNEFFSTFDKSKIYNKIINPIEHLEVFNGGACIWSAIYKHKFLKEHNIKFLETPGASYQDTSFWIKVLFETSRIMYVEQAYNYYRIDNINSSVNDNSKIFCICDELHELEKRYKKDSFKLKLINTIKIDKYNWNYKRLGELGKKEFSKILKKEIKPIYDQNLYIENVIPQSVITSCQSFLYKEIEHNTLVEKIFSIKNLQKHKMVTVLGLKIKIKNTKF